MLYHRIWHAGADLKVIVKGSEDVPFSGGCLCQDTLSKTACVTCQLIYAHICICSYTAQSKFWLTHYQTDTGSHDLLSHRSH